MRSVKMKVSVAAVKRKALLETENDIIHVHRSKQHRLFLQISSLDLQVTTFVKKNLVSSFMRQGYWIQNILLNINS